MAEVHGMVKEHNKKNIQLETSVFLLYQHNKGFCKHLMSGLVCIANVPV